MTKIIKIPKTKNHKFILTHGLGDSNFLTQFRKIGSDGKRAIVDTGINDLRIDDKIISGSISPMYSNDEMELILVQ